MNKDNDTIANNNNFNKKYKIQSIILLKMTIVYTIMEIMLLIQEFINNI